MKKLLLLTLFMSSLLAAIAQNRTLVKGKVVDSADKKPIEFATVALIDAKDSSLLSYTLTDKSGGFTLNKLPLGKPLKIIISFFAYQKFRTNLIFSKPETSTDLGIVSLSSKMLNEIAVKGEVTPIVVKKDTVEFNAEAFKTRPNAVIEELLKKLPGVQINSDGSIIFNGKNISKLLIDGKEFFGNDPKIATRNMDADIVAQVQIYDDRENDPDHLISETKVNKIINIKLKKAIKKSTFGKVYAGGGTHDRYESGGLFNMFRDTLQVSLIGLSNNLNRTGFSYDDLSTKGGFNRSGRDAIYNGSIPTGGRNYAGIEQLTSGGFNINTDYGKKLKLNLLYFYSQSDVVQDNVFYTQRFLNDTTLLSRSKNHSERTNYKHALSGLIDWKPDEFTQVRYVPVLNVTSNNSGSLSSANTNNNFNQQISNVLSNDNDNGSGTQFQQDLSYYRTFKKKGESLNITHNLQVNPNRSNQYYYNDLQSYTMSLPSDTTDRYTSTSVVNTSLNLNVGYRYPLTKRLTGGIVLTGAYSRSGQQLFNFDKNIVTGMYDLLLQDQSTDVKRDQWTEMIRTELTYKFTETFSVIAAATNQWQNIDNNFSDHSKLIQNYYNLFPSLRIETGKFSISYDRTIRQPSITDIQPITLTYSPLYSFTGNPLLKPTILNTGNINFQTYKTKTQVGFYVYSDLTIEQNSVVRQQTISSTGAQTSTSVNRDGQSNFGLGGSFNKRFKKSRDWQTGLYTSVYGGLYRSMLLLNQTESRQDRYYWSLTQNFTLNWKDKIDLNSSVGMRQSLVRYSGDTTASLIQNNTNQNTNNYNLSNNLIIRWPNRIVWEVNQKYSYNSQVAPGFQKGINVLSTSVALQMFKKDRGQIKLSVYDLLNQNTNVFRSVGNNSITDVESQILKRYFLLTYQYKFNKTSTK